MSGRRPLAAGFVAGFGLLGLSVTGGLAIMAHRIVDEFSRPHILLDSSVFTWKVPGLLVEPPRTCQRSLLFATGDGKLLSGEFWAQPQPAPTVVLCHGYRVSRTHLRSVATLEYTCGYNILLFDFRGHGCSESVVTSGGNAEVHDLVAALEVACQQAETLQGAVIIHGFSMGAAVALLMPPHPAVAAIIADSPFAHLDDVLRRLVHFRLTYESSQRKSWLRHLRHLSPMLAWCTVLVSTLIFRLRFGFNFVASPVSSFKRWYARRSARRVSESNRVIPILLIHATSDPLIPFAHAQQIAAAARQHTVPLETYFVESDVHCGAYGADPQEYQRMIREFLLRHLGEAFPEKHWYIDENACSCSAYLTNYL